MSLGFSADIPIIDIGHETAWIRLGAIYISDITLILLLIFNRSTPKPHFTGSVFTQESLQIFLSFIIFSLWQLITILFSIDPLATIFSSIQLLRGILILYALVVSVRNYETLRVAIYSIITIAFINGFWAILQQLNGGSIGLTHLGERALSGENYKVFYIDGQIYLSYISGFIGMPYRLGGFLILILPCFWALILANNTSTKEKLTLIIGVVGCSAAVYFCYSRAIWISYAFSTIFIFFILVLKQNINVKWLMTLLIITGYIAINYYANLEGRFLYSNIDKSIEHRIDFFKTTFEILDKNFLTGIGFGASSHYSSITIHSLYLLCLAESGIIGFILFIFFIVCVLRAAVSALFSGDSDVEIISLGLLSGIIAILLQGIVTWESWRTEINSVYMAIIGLLCATLQISKEKNNSLKLYHTLRKQIAKKKI